MSRGWGFHHSPHRAFLAALRDRGVFFVLLRRRRRPEKQESPLLSGLAAQAIVGRSAKRLQYR
jgi:hypothetical protein